jgi:hypothetical protein
MPDDKSKRGRQDRAKISLGEKYEVTQAAKTAHVSPKAIQEAVAKVGHGRKNVYAEVGKAIKPTKPASTKKR